MGHQSRIRTKRKEEKATVAARSERPKIVHHSKFMGGRESVESVYRSTAWKGRRCLCGAEPSVRIRMWGEEAEVVKRATASRAYAREIEMLYGGSTPKAATFTYGRFIRVSDTFACSSCRRVAEKEAARAPGWMFAELDDISRFTKVQA